MQPTQYIWLNGKFVPWNEAKIHVLTHALHYGTGLFEGIRVYATRKGRTYSHPLNNIILLSAP